MENSIVSQIARLRAMTVGQLQERYAEVFGEQAKSRNKDYLWKRIAYRIQEQTEGGISDRARRRADELARDADLRVVPDQRRLARAAAPPPPPARDPRLPPPGTTLTRDFGGKRHEVRVLADAFEYAGRRFTSLSAAACAIAGTRWNGFLFFGLATRDKDAA